MSGALFRQRLNLQESRAGTASLTLLVTGLQLFQRPAKADYSSAGNDFFSGIGGGYRF